MSQPYRTITFYQRFEKDILTGKKTITIRDQAEANYREGSCWMF
ncbi:ASCH domain-containing protein [Dongshaea marina]